MREVQLLCSIGAVTVSRVFRPSPDQPKHALSKLDAQQLVRELRRDSNHSALAALYALATGLEPHMPSRMRDRELFTPIDRAVESEQLLFTKGWPTSQQRQHAQETAEVASPEDALARAIMGDRDALVFEGRRYRLLATVRPPGPRAQDGYGAVGLVETTVIVKRMAESIPATPEARARWAQVVALVTKPGRTEGLTLLRYAPSGGAAAAHTAHEPAATPTQLRAATAPEHWIEIEIVYEDGGAFSGNCVVELPDGRITEGPPSVEGIVRLDHLTPGTCKVRFPELDADAFKTA